MASDIYFYACMDDPVKIRELEEWKWLTQKLFLNYPAMEVIEKLLEVYAGTSDFQFVLGFKDVCFYETEGKDAGKIKEIEEKKEYIPVKNSSGVTAKINEKLSILKVAAEYGLKLKGNKCICPFHPDSNPSLTFDTARNRFKCWSSNCGKKGNLIDFMFECEQVGLVRRKNEE